MCLLSQVEINSTVGLPKPTLSTSFPMPHQLLCRVPKLHSHLQGSCDLTRPVRLTILPFVTRCPPAPSRPPTPFYLPHIFLWHCLWYAGPHQHTVLLRWALSTTKWPRWLERGPVDGCANPRVGSKRRHAEWGKVGASRTCQGDPELTRLPWGCVRPCCRPFSLGTSDRAAVQSGSQGHLHS